MDQVARLLDFGDSQACVHLFTITPREDNAGRLQDREVLREVRLRDTDRILKVTEAAFSLAQDVEQVNAERVGKGFADDCLSLEDLGFDFSHSLFGHSYQLHNFATDQVCPTPFPRICDRGHMSMQGRLYLKELIWPAKTKM